MSCKVVDGIGEADVATHDGILVHGLRMSFLEQYFLPGESELGPPHEPRYHYLPHQKVMISAEKLTWNARDFVQVLKRGDTAIVFEDRWQFIEVYHPIFRRIHIDKRHVDLLPEGRPDPAPAPKAAPMSHRQLANTNIFMTLREMGKTRREMFEQHRHSDNKQTKRKLSKWADPTFLRKTLAALGADFGLNYHQHMAMCKSKGISQFDEIELFIDLMEKAKV